MRQLVFLLILIPICWSCNEKQEKVPITSYNGPLSTSVDIKAVFKDSNKTVITFFAKKQLEFQGGDLEFPEGVFVEFFNPQGIKTSTLNSNYAKYIKALDKWEIRDKVVMKNVNKEETLHTEELIYERKTKKIYTTKKVKIVRPDYEITGIGLESDENFENYKLHQVIGKKYLK